MTRTVRLGGKLVGNNQPVFIIAEIGINHNGDLDLARKLIDSAVLAGCDAVKFQKRVPELCVPENLKNMNRETPWGIMTYLEYRHRVEFSKEQYEQIDRYCREKGILWFASCWDRDSVDFLDSFDSPCIKVSSACLTNDHLLRHICSKRRPVILATGMSTMDEIRHAVSLLDSDSLMIAHTTSTYPCKIEEMNLRMIAALQREFDCPIGYSGHETGIQTSVAAAALGASFVERHITIDRAMWGSDQAASLEPVGLIRLVRDIRVVESALGDGVKRVYESELPLIARLRK
jgi:N-acetylneuraminate synthase